MLNLGYPAQLFDAAICVFGIFFVPDMESAIRELWRMVKPGGQLAITTWGPNLFEPANSIFWEAIARERAELREGFHPWDRICDPAGVQAMLRGGGVETTDIVAETGTHPLTSPDDCWPIVLGSGYRGTTEQLPPDARERVRQAMVHQLRDRQITSVQTNVVYARAVKGAESRQPERQYV
jgi:SAM-dependent methyltransferase